MQQPWSRHPADPRDSLRRDAWRTALFHQQVAEDEAASRRATAMRRAIAIGVALGVIGSISLLL
jgi:hypothetical protein